MDLLLLLGVSAVFIISILTGGYEDKPHKQ
ncbi:hypothetical protein B0H94_107219 [Salsuginibacillus halophilus]|uniref:Uncharacterized protein n=1 Tax=Salsuginibacillus halophilus TaxID=517424 RepID=A0A2P8HG91_9BACI|nr:hypothetical protein B0H94_107219 [Salsuginibacillus halophilus]